MWLFLSELIRSSRPGLRPEPRQNADHWRPWLKHYCARAWQIVMPHSKFRNKKVELDGHVFDSQAEAKHYLYTLKPRLEAGEISHLEIHPRIRCEINGRKICDYLADFRYFDSSQSGPDGQVGCQVVEDVKGFKTDVYKLKKKLVEALYPGTKISEISPRAYRSKPLS